MANAEDLKKLTKSTACPNGDLTHAKLRGVDLKGAQLRGANLMRADLAESILSEADLRGANLAGANLRGTNLEWADLRGSDLDGADFTDANLRGAFLGGARICNTTMPDGSIKFTGCAKRPFLEEDTIQPREQRSLCSKTDSPVLQATSARTALDFAGGSTAAGTTDLVRIHNLHPFFQNPY